MYHGFEMSPGHGVHVFNVLSHDKLKRLSGESFTAEMKLQ